MSIIDLKNNIARRAFLQGVNQGKIPESIMCQGLNVNVGNLLTKEAVSTLEGCIQTRIELQNTRG